METRKHYGIVLFVFLTFALVSNLETESEDEDLFVPTQEWQIIKKGQKLPKGLHIRINLETGKKEAKLVDTNDDKTKLVQIVTTNEEDPPSAGDLKLSEAALKHALKNIKNDQATNNDKVEHLNEFRTYKELKQELSDLNLNLASDSELLKGLMDKFKKLTGARKIDKLHILNVIEDIDYLVHQSDNAIEFVRLKGFEEVIYKNLNSSIIEIKLESLKLLGSLVQNNPKVQIYALDTGSLDFLLRMFVLNSDLAIKSRVVFALGSLIRHFPLAQLKFIESAGLNVFLELMSNTSDIRIQLKIVILINDLVLEYIDALDEEDRPEKLSQYNKIDIKHKLKEFDWCRYVTTLLKNIYNIDKNDHDGIEKSLNAILTVVDDCRSIYINNIINILEDLQLRYDTLAFAAITSDDGLDAEYCKHMQNLCTTIINYNKLIKKYKTEL